MVAKDSSGQIVRTNGNGGLAAFLQNHLKDQIAVALPKHLDAERMTRVALTALRTTPKLAQCSVPSFAAAIIQAAQLGLEVNTPLGHAYLIPRKMKDRGMEATLQIGYQGMLDLARRSGQVSSIFAYTVHEGDAFEYTLGLDPTLRHVPGDDEATAGNMTHVYAVGKLRGDDADRQFVVLTKRAVEKRKARGAGGPAWRTDYLAMAKKTAVRALFTWLPKSPEMASAVRLDDAEVRRATLAESVDPGVHQQLTEGLGFTDDELAAEPEDAEIVEGEGDDAEEFSDE